MGDFIRIGYGSFKFCVTHFGLQSPPELFNG